MEFGISEEGKIVEDQVVRFLNEKIIPSERDTPVTSMWRNGRALRIADGPDEVHKMGIARRELKRFA